LFFQLDDSGEAALCPGKFVLHPPLAWPAILLASMLDAPTSWRHVMLTRRNECGPRLGKLQPSAVAARWSSILTVESHIGFAGSRACGKIQASGILMSESGNPALMPARQTGDSESTLAYLGLRLSMF
jgi:hypothetical protein